MCGVEQRILLPRHRSRDLAVQVMSVMLAYALSNGEQQLLNNAR